jgi:hypothetical protein
VSKIPPLLFMDIKCPPHTLGNFSKCCPQYFLKILTLGKETMNSTNMKVFVSVSVLLEPRIRTDPELLEPALEQILMLLEPALELQTPPSFGVLN